MSNVGKLIYGFCDGFFGRESYDNKRIEAEGPDWIVSRELREDAVPEFCAFRQGWDKQELIDKWVVKPEEEQ
jgi:hypothetical protein